MKIIFIFIVTCMVSLSAFALSADDQADGYVLPSTEVKQIISKINNHTYRMFVHLPDGYDRSKSSSYPVFYVLDGQWDFSFIVNIYGKLNYDKILPKAITVGISWDPDDRESGARRRDLVNITGEASGAKVFMQILKGEIIPEIERLYGTTGPRLITGTSLGASFVLYALLENPSLFESYIALSPNYIYSLDGSEQVLKEKIEEFNSGPEKDLRLYTACENNSDCIANLRPLLTNLATISPNKLKTNFETFGGLGHAGVSLLGNIYGFRKMYSDVNVVPK